MAEEKEEIPKPLNEYLFTWRVENVNLCWQKTGEKLKSPTFEIEWLSKSPFHLCLYPKGTEGNGDCISYFFCYEDKASLNNKEFKTELYLFDANGSNIDPESNDGFWSMRRYGMIGCPRFMRWRTLMRKKSDYLPDGILTVRCRIWSEKLEMEDQPTEETAYPNEGFARTQIKSEVIAKQMVIDNIASKGQKIGEMTLILRDCPFAIFYVSFGEISGNKKLVIDIDVLKSKIKMATFKIMIFDEKRKRAFWKKAYSWKDIDEFENIVLSSHFPPNSEQHVPHEMFGEKFLFLVCQFTYTTGLIEQRREKYNYGTNLYDFVPRYFPRNVQTVQCQSLKDALFSMHEDKLFHDVTIKTGTSNITAHKIVVCSRSATFDTLLKIQETRDLPPVIEIEDDIETLKKVVYFLYTDNISNINWRTANTLYSAAMKYQINLLRLKCFDFIKANFEKSNVTEILLLAKKHNDMEMIHSARSFVMENRSEIYNTNEWNNFRKSHSDFATEMMLPFQSN